MVNTSITPAKTVIDPKFDLPEGLDSFVYDTDKVAAESNTLNTELSDVISTSTNAVSIDESDIDDYAHDAPPVPQLFTIKSQTIHMSPDGKQLVDVEIEVEDIPGVIQIDVRVTKT